LLRTPRTLRTNLRVSEISEGRAFMARPFCLCAHHGSPTSRRIGIARQLAGVE
jgi:hypothetical protein